MILPDTYGTKGFLAGAPDWLAGWTGIRVDSSGDPVINWQRSGAGTLVAASEIGAPGEVAALPAALTATEGETIIVSEVFYDFEPIFGLSASPGVFRKVAYVKPRLGTLETLLP